MPELTEKQDRFVTEYVANGCTATEAARRSGYEFPRPEAYRLTRLPHVQEAVKALQTHLIAGPGTSLAVKTLCRVMEDPAAPASAQVSAARTMLEAAGRFSSKAADDTNKPMNEMSYDELAAVVQRANDVVEGRIDDTRNAAAAIQLGDPSPLVN